MAPAEVMMRLDRFKKASKPSGHITVTELARGRDWRKELPEVGLMQVTDRGETAGWLISQEDLDAIVYAVISLEEDLEERSIAALFAARPPEKMEWKSGKELAEGAMRYFEEHGDEIRAIVDEYR